MLKIVIIAASVAALSAPAFAQVNVETESKVGQPGAAPKPGPRQPAGNWEDIKVEGVKSGKPPAVQSPRDSQSGLPTGKR
jgi:hypothetical protein